MTNKPDPLEWHKDKPPHIGWWNASTIRDEKAWRWWNGKRWSVITRADTVRDEYAGFNAAHATPLPSQVIEWRWYYPENARVPRIDPRKQDRPARN